MCFRGGGVSEVWSKTILLQQQKNLGPFPKVINGVKCLNYNIITLGNTNIFHRLEGVAAYGHLLLAPAESWWPSATCRALQALFSFRCLGGPL